MSVPVTPSLSRYEDRFDPSKQWERLMFRDGAIMQAAEFNEMQRVAEWRATSVSDALFADGDIVSGGTVSLVGATQVQCAAARVYLAGAVRDVPAVLLDGIDFTGTVSVGIRLAVTAITEVDDAGLLNPAVGYRAYGEPGAGRMKVTPYWSWSGATATDAYSPIYIFDDGAMRPKEPPPEAAAITQAIAKYDVDSSGGDYIVSGCAVSAANTPVLDASQVYVVGEGRARVSGFPINVASAIRATFTPSAPVQRVNVEPHTAAGGTETITAYHYPIKSVVEVHLRKTKTVTITRGGSAGGSDTLPDSSVETIVSVSQGATNYVATTDYLFTGATLSWSPAGAEPSTGTTYSVTYIYIWTGAPVSSTQTTITVSGATVGTTIECTYDYLLPRVDVLCLNKSGLVQFVSGAPAPVVPWTPKIPQGLLPLAKIYQTWDSRRTISAAGVIMVSMETLAGLQSKLDRLLMLVAQDRLNFNAQFRDQALKKSVLSDPFLDDTLRDSGSTQTAAIVDGLLMLPVALTPTLLANSTATLDGTVTVLVEQTRRTGAIKVNPYMTGSPVPATMALVPTCDYWVDYASTFTSPVTRRVVGDVAVGSAVQTTDVISKISLTDVAHMRQISVMFALAGFAPNETLASFQIDGVDATVVTP